MSHACDICGKEFSRKANLVRHRDTIHGDVTDMPSGEEVLDAETGQNRSTDIFDDTDNSSEEATTEHDRESLESSEEEVSTVSQDDVSEDESVKDSWEAESTTETESDQSGSESDASSTVSSNSSFSDEGEEYGYDSGDEEEWTLYRDWSIPLKHEPGDVPQRVIKETKRAGKTFYLVEFAAMPRYDYNIEYNKSWVPEQTLMKKYGYLVRNNTASSSCRQDNFS
ncbi:Crystallin, lambda 1 [Branchiostoma belcheri]|nr:Crystallin, lambda 1 [Branchiostoma belcheri]